jgi:phage gp46-like protein
MPFDYKFDAVTGDLVRDGKGGFVLVETAETAVQEQLRHRYQAWWGAPQRGSLLGDIRSLVGRDKAQAAQAEAQRALRVLEQAGRISNVQVIAEQQAQGRVVVSATFRDTSTGQVVEASTKTRA